LGFGVVCCCGAASGRTELKTGLGVGVVFCCGAASSRAELTTGFGALTNFAVTSRAGELNRG
jgi:hypothetical protein